MGQRIFFILMICFFFSGYSNAGPTPGQVSFDSLALTRQLSSEAAQIYARRMTDLIAERQRLSAVGGQAGEIPPENLARIARINDELQELSRKKSLALGSDRTWKAFENVRVMYQTLQLVENSMDQTDTWSSDATWADKATGGLLAKYQGALQAANQGRDYGQRLLALKGLVEKLDQKAPTPAFKKMQDGLNSLFWLMTTFGDKTGLPGVSDFIQHYGDAGTAMVGASARIYRRILDREGNQLLPGRHGDDGRYTAFEKQFPRLAERLDIIKPQIPGLPDVYESGDGGVLIWDRHYKRWYRTHPNDPQKASLPEISNLGPNAGLLSPDQVLQRYVFLKQNGEPDPSVFTVLADPARVVALSLASDRKVVEPGGETGLHLSAVTMGGDRRPIVLAKLGARPKASISERLISSRSGYIEPSLVDLSQPEKIVWRAPGNSNTVFEITATLSGDNDDNGLIQVGSAMVEVATGGPSRLKVSVEPAVCQPLGDGQVHFSLVDGDGDPVAAPEGKTADEIVVINGSGGLLVESPRWIDRESGKGWAAWHAPNATGDYKLEVSFRGFFEHGLLFSRAALGAEQVATVTVVGDGSDDGDETGPQASNKQAAEDRKDPPGGGDATEAEALLLLSRRLAREMRAVHEAAQGAGGILSRVCPEGAALAEGAGPALENIRSLAGPLLEDMRNASARLPEAQSALEKVVAAGNEAGELGLKVVEAKQEAENESAAACRAGAGFGAAADDAGRDAVKRQGEKAALKAQYAALRAKQAYIQALAVKNGSVGEGGARVTDAVVGVTALTGRVADIRGKIARLQTAEGQLNQLALQAEQAWTDLGVARERAKSILIEAAALTDAENPEVQERYGEIRSLGAEVVEGFQEKDGGSKPAPMGAGYSQCPLNLRNRADQLGLDLDTLKRTSAALDEAEAGLPADADLASLKERYDQAAADVVSAVDVAQVFAEAAQSFGGDAENCLNRLLAQELALKKAPEKKKDDEDAAPPAFVSDAGGSDDVPAFVKHSGSGADASAKMTDSAAKVTDSSPAVSAPRKLVTRPPEKRKKSAIDDLYGTKKNWQDGIVDTRVKMDAQTQKTYGGAVSGRKGGTTSDSGGGGGILGVEFEQKHSIGADE